jgi:hypothetical protein
MGSTININATIIPEKLESANAWKVSIPPYIFRQFVLQACKTNCLNMKGGMLTFQARVFNLKDM